MIYTHHDKVGITCTTLKPKGKWCCKEMNLDSMVLEERMIECNTVVVGALSNTVGDENWLQVHRNYIIRGATEIRQEKGERI